MQVRRAPDAPELHIQRAGQSGPAEARRILKQQMDTAEQCGQRQQDRLLLADDEAGDIAVKSYLESCCPGAVSSRSIPKPGYGT